MQVHDIDPDIVTTAKALGGGIACGAVLVGDAVASHFGPGDLGTTFGGGPVAAAAIVAVIDAIENDDLLANVRAREAQIRNEFARAGRRFLGVEGVMRQRPSDSPDTAAPRRRVSPRVATRDGTRRREALVRLKEFATAYRDALRRWREGLRDVVFPAGTYAMRVFHGAECVGT